MELPPTGGLAMTPCTLAGAEPQQRPALSADGVDQQLGPTRRWVTVIRRHEHRTADAARNGQIT